MTATRSLSDGAVEAALRPLSAEETKEAADWPELHLDPASWIEGDQVWVLELQPYDPPTGGRDFEEMQQPASAESKSSSVQSGQSSATEAGISECQHWSDEVTNSPSTLKRTTRIFTSDRETLSQTVNLTAEQNTHIKYRHFCNQCGKGFQWPSQLRQHSKRHYRSFRVGKNAARQCQWPSEANPQNPLAPLPFQTEKIFADSSKAYSLKSSLMTKHNLHICNKCGKGFRWPSHLSRHYQCHYRHLGIKKKAARQDQCQSEAYSSPSPLVPIPLPLQAENMFADTCEKISSKSSLMADQGTLTKSWYICDNCGKGFQSLSEVIQHQLVHSEGETVQSSQWQSELLIPTPLAPVSLQDKVHTCANSCETLSHSSKLMTDQSNHAKDPQLCDQCGKGFQSLSELSQHQLMHSEGETAQSNQCQSEIPSLNPLTPVSLRNKENTCTYACETLNLKSTDQSTCTRNRYICKQCGKYFRWPSDLRRHNQRLHSRKKVTKLGKCQSKANPQSPLLSAPFQAGHMFGDASKTSRPKSSLRRNKKRYTCKQCQKVFQWPSHLKRHYRRHHKHLEIGKETDLLGRGQSEACSPSPLALTSLPLQGENMSADACEMFSPKSSVMGNQSTWMKNLFSCDQCEKGFQSFSEVTQHQLIHYGEEVVSQGLCQLEVFPVAPVSLQVQNKFLSQKSLFRSKLMPEMSQNRHTNNPCICDHCGKGFRWPSGLARHQRVHFGKKAAGTSQCLSNMPNSSLLAPTPLHVETVSAESSETSSQKPVLITCTKKLHFCNQCGKGFQGLPSLVRHQFLHSGEKKARWVSRKRGQSEAYSLRPFIRIPLRLQKETMPANSSEAVKQNDRHNKKQHLRNWNRTSSLSRTSSFVHNQSAHAKEKTFRRDKRQSKTYSLRPVIPIPLHLQTDYTLVNISKTFGQNAKLRTEEVFHTQKKNICSHCGKCFRCPSELAQHHWHLSRGISRRNQSWSKVDGSSPLIANPASPQTESTFTDGHKTINQSSQLMIDQRTYLKKVSSCDQCGKCFWWPSRLAVHKRTHSRRENVRRRKAKREKSHSDICSSLDPVSKPLQMENKLTNVCEPLSQSSSLSKDKMTHTKKTCFCNQCGEGFQCRTDLGQHVDTHSSEQPYYGCAICGKEFKRRVQLVKHQKSHEERCEEEGEEEYQRHPGTCEQEAFSQDIATEQLESHFPEVAEELCQPLASPKVCECGMCYTGEGDSFEPLPANSFWEIGSNGHPHILSVKQLCEFGNCGTSGHGSIDTASTEPSSLEADITACVELMSSLNSCKSESMLGEEAFAASTTTTTCVGLPPAMASQDPEEPPSLSTPAGQAPYLEEGGKTYICSRCPKQFSCASYLTKHVRTHQAGKPYSCTICMKRFAQRSYLAKHLRLHTVGAGHTCPDCGTWFTQLPYLRKHMQKHMHHNSQ